MRYVIMPAAPGVASISGIPGQRGQAAVEAAMTFLLLFVFIFAIFEAGRLVEVQQVLTQAAREGARWAVAPLPGTDTPPSDADVMAVVSNQMRAAALNTSRLVDPGTLVVHNVACAGSHAQCVEVTVRYSYPAAVLTLFGVDGLVLTGKAQMRQEWSAYN
jgi:Flp pilus assembly protein TadG